jgi:HlyD family secretion protein
MRGNRRIVLFAGGAAIVAGIAIHELWPHMNLGVAEVGAVPEVAPTGARDVEKITALGRIEPKDGIIRVSGPSHPAVVIGQLLIDVNDHVTAGQTIAILDNYDSAKAEVARLEAELLNTDAERNRYDRLYKDGFVSPSERDTWRTKLQMLQAQLERAKAELAQAVVRSPVTGRVLDVHARAGERVGLDGIAELGQTDAMFAVAEVYETDVQHVRVGQRATISSPALPHATSGTVDRVGLKIGKKDVLSVDPAAKTDARVVEVRIALDDAKEVDGFTNLEVDVAITP